MLFNGLFFKEWKMTQGFMYTAFIIAVAACVISFGSPGFEIILGAIIIGYTVVPLYVLFSLNSEANQLAAFLHQVHPAGRLLLVKIGTGILLALAYLLLTFVCLVLLLMLRYGDAIMYGKLLSDFMGFSLSALLISMYPTVILLFLWQVYRIWRAKFGAISMIMIVVFLMAGNYVMNIVRECKLYEKLVYWGEYTIQFGAAAPASKHVHVAEMQIGGSFYLGMFIFYGVLTVVYFFISCWLLDKKVGV